MEEKEYVVKILDTEYVAHNVKRFTIEKPNQYSFIPGQATEMSINNLEFRKRKNPFSFTSLNNWDYLEFIIKIYRERNGFTKELEKLKDGDELIIRNPFGTINYNGSGVFIAGGAGITPFVAILRELSHKNEIGENILIFSVKTSEDIILKSEFEQMLGDNFYTVLTREHVIGYMDRRIDEDYLKDVVKNFNRQFYVCGPEKFVNDIQNMFLNLGALPETIVIER